MARPRKVRNPEELRIALEHFEQIGSIEFDQVLRERSRFSWKEEAGLFLQFLEQTVKELTGPPKPWQWELELPGIRRSYQTIRALIREDREDDCFAQAMQVCLGLDRFTKVWDSRREIWDESSYVLRPCGYGTRWDPSVWHLNKECRDYEKPGSWSRRARERIQNRFLLQR